MTKLWHRCLLTVAALRLHMALAAINNAFPVSKPLASKQSTKYQFADNPALATDGVTNGTYLPGVSCLHTADTDLHPWWLVDMEHNYLTVGASVWNRINCCAARFTRVSIGVSSNQLVWANFSADMFDLCMYWGGVPRAADNPINFTCARPIAGRYLAVYKNVSDLPNYMVHLHFCEIDIFAIHRRTEIYHAVPATPSFSATSSSLIAKQTLAAASEVECIAKCANFLNCWYVMLQPGSRNCWLFSSLSISDSFRAPFEAGELKIFGITV